MNPVHYYYGFDIFNCFNQLEADHAKVCHKEIPNVKAAYIGWSNAIYVTDNGEAFVTGFLGVNESRGKVSQLRLSKEYWKVSHAVLGRTKFCIVTENGDAYFWKDAESQPDCISDLKNVKDIVLGTLEGVVLLSGIPICVVRAPHLLTQNTLFRWNPGTGLLFHLEVTVSCRDQQNYFHSLRYGALFGAYQ